MSFFDKNWKDYSKPLVNGNKIHENAYLYSKNNEKYLIKKTSTREWEFLNILKDCEAILQPLDYSNSYALYEYIEKSDDRDSLLFHKSSIQEIALVHNFSNISTLPLNKFGTKEYVEWFNLFYKKGIKDGLKIKNSAKEVFFKSAKSIDGIQGIVHNDFLPENVLKANGRTYIIDWEHARIGFSEADIGRYLGINIPGRRFISKDHYEFLVDVYLEERYKRDNSYDRIKGKVLIKVGEFFNSWNNIAMCIGCNDIQKALPYVRHFEDQAELVSDYFKNL